MSLRLKHKFGLPDQIFDSAARLGYEKSVKLRLITIHYGRHALDRVKSETRTEFLVWIIDEKDVFTDANIWEFKMKKQLKEDVKMWSGRIWFILDFSSIILSTGKKPPYCIRDILNYMRKFEGLVSKYIHCL